jgi:hypothetical protein
MDRDTNGQRLRNKRTGTGTQAAWDRDKTQKTGTRTQTGKDTNTQDRVTNGRVQGHKWAWTKTDANIDMNRDFDTDMDNFDRQNY